MGDTEGRLHPLGRQVLLFLALYACLQWSWIGVRGPALDEAVIAQGTVRPAVWFINLLTPAAQARPDGARIRAEGGGIQVLNGCEGIEVFFLLVAALAVAPLRWRERAWGIVLGLPLVWLLNQARVVALFYAWRDDKSLFALLHGTVAPLALVVGAVLLFMGFLALVQQRQHGAGA